MALVFRSSLDDSAFTSAIRRMGREVSQFAKQTEASMKSLQSSLPGGGLLGTLGIGPGTIGLSGAAAALRMVIKEGDNLTSSLAKIDAATNGVGDSSAIYQKLFQNAKETGAAVEESASKFARFSIAARQVGATSDEVIKLISLIEKAGAISGASASESSAASAQLAQALASGRLQGDELRSIMENMPLLAEQLANNLGVSIGELRQMGAEGELTANVVFPALLKSADAIEKKFEQMPVTAARAFTRLSAQIRKTAADADKEFGLSSFISRTLGGTPEEQAAQKRHDDMIKGAAATDAQAMETVRRAQRVRIGLPEEDGAEYRGPLQVNAGRRTELENAAANAMAAMRSEAQAENKLNDTIAEADQKRIAEVQDFEQKQKQEFIQWRIREEIKADEKIEEANRSRKREKLENELQIEKAKLQVRQADFETADNRFTSFNTAENATERRNLVRQFNREDRQNARNERFRNRRDDPNFRDARFGAARLGEAVDNTKFRAEISEQNIAKIVSAIDALTVKE